MASHRIQHKLLITAVASAAVLAASAQALTATPQAPAAASQHQTTPQMLNVGAQMQAAPLPPACSEAIFKTKEKFPTTRYTVPDEPWNALLSEVVNLTEAEQAELTESACAAWNSWATANGPVVAKDLDTRWQNAAAPACNKWAVATMGSVKKYAPTIPAETRKLEALAKKVWQGAMTKLSTEAPDAACRTAYNKVKGGW
ncbi:hypothetical protein J2S54_006923 [Streptomyces sp. DSM 42143]|uniref:hypothetical protein n=1 Tax=Streptomyces TaxID=1883 RepID=UPI000BC98B32|nr:MULTISPECIES: hypothetical protein [unclassified Streptomyces]MDQ0390103.1 hypothetical protein [Streptomyces sp. DSM 42143]PAK22944.1 hypothetical protein CJD44_32115 [Streptomyces sp. alain-838]